MTKRRHKTGLLYLILTAATAAVLVLCVSLGSVRIPVGETARVFLRALSGEPQSSGKTASIILRVRFPRVLCVALTGGSLSICGAVMQGLLLNPLADGSTLGVSSGASLGAAAAIAFDLYLPFLPVSATMGMAMLFAFFSLLFILSLAYGLDHALSTNTIILLGIVFSMFISSILSLLLTFSADKVKNITFWTMGSLAGSSYGNAAVLAAALLVCGGVMLFRVRELNAFAVSGDNAENIGVDVRRTRLILLIAVSALIGVCVSIGGAIGFVGLVTPHVVRMLAGPDHGRLLPLSLFCGAIFLMLCDLAARMIVRPVELPIGVVTSFVGAVFFVFIFYRTRRKQL